MTSILDSIFSTHQTQQQQNSATFLSEQATRPSTDYFSSISRYIQWIDPCFSKENDIWVFRLDGQKITSLKGEKVPSNVEIMVTLKLSANQMQLAFFILTSLGELIKAKNTNHKIVLFNYALQVNQMVQWLKIKCNPISGEFCAHFSVSIQEFSTNSVMQILEFSLKTYICQQMPAHLYVLNILEYNSSYQNLYLENIQKNMAHCKEWILSRAPLYADMKKRNSQCFVQNFKSQSNNTAQSNMANCQDQSQPKLRLINELLYFLNAGEKSLINNNQFINSAGCYDQEIQNDPKFSNSDQKKLQRFYSDEIIFYQNVIPKSKYQNILPISIKKNMLIEKLIVMKTEKRALMDERVSKLNHLNNQGMIQITLEQNNSQKQSYFGRKRGARISGWCNNQNSSILNTRIYFMSRDHAKKELAICDRLCKGASFLFLNQYLQIQNYQLQKFGFLTVNSYPSRQNMDNHISKRSSILSFATRVSICVTILKSVLTLNLKSKIANYFPELSLKNLQISFKHSISFKLLSKYCPQPTIYILSQVISQILFKKRNLSILKKSQKNLEKCLSSQIITEISDFSRFGASTWVSFIQFYLQSMRHDGLAIFQSLFRLKNMQSSKQKIEQYQNWSQYRFTTACQDLLVLFGTVLDKGQENKILNKLQKQVFIDHEQYTRSGIYWQYQGYSSGLRFPQDSYSGKFSGKLQSTASSVFRS